VIRGEGSFQEYYMLDPYNSYAKDGIGSLNPILGRGLRLLGDFYKSGQQQHVETKNPPRHDTPPYSDPHTPQE